MVKKNILMGLILLFLSGCSILHIHRVSTEQGNIITPKAVSRLHKGMSTHEVKEVLGTPMLVNVLDNDHIVYVHTFDDGYGKTSKTRLILNFSHGTLRDWNYSY